MFPRRRCRRDRATPLLLACLVILTVLKVFQSFSESSSTSESEEILPANFSLEDLLSKRAAANRKVLAQCGLSLPSPGETYKRIMIITTFRSGSTFTAELLSQIPGAVFFNEPLLYFSQHYKIKEKESLVAKPLSLLYQMLECDFGPLLKEYRWFPKDKSTVLRFNAAYLLCKEAQEGKYCENAEYLSQACRYFPIQVTKLVRLPLQHVVSFLRRPELHLHIILLVRDPRGTMASRRLIGWCKEGCADPEKLCDLLRENYKTALRVAQEFPEHFTVLRYEDLATDPETHSSWLLQRLGIPVTPSIAEYIKTHTDPELIDNGLTFRSRGSRVTVWKKNLPWKDIQKVQFLCHDVLENYGYVPVNSSDTLIETETVQTNWKLPGILN